jgi:hypothetical protein
MVSAVVDRRASVRAVVMAVVMLAVGAVVLREHDSVSTSGR